ncbi:MAG: hypothetical protein AAGA69_09055 [Pseudomonadota bacterium]
MNAISNTLLQQRIRNRLIEYFDTSFEEIASWGAFEIINMWEDIIPNGWDETFFVEPVFSPEEQGHIKRFISTWDLTADATPDDIFDIVELERSPQWRTFLSEAKSALDCFMKRGKFTEDAEQF